MSAKLFECPVCKTKRRVVVEHHDSFVCNPVHHHATGIFADSSGCGKLIYLPGKHAPGANVAVAREVAE